MTYYTESEVKTIESLYPYGDKDEILNKINHSWANIVSKAARMGVKREIYRRRKYSYNYFKELWNENKNIEPYLLEGVKKVNESIP